MLFLWKEEDGGKRIFSLLLNIIIAAMLLWR